MGSFSLKVQLHLHEFDSHKDHRLAASGDMEITHQWRWGFMRRKKKKIWSEERDNDAPISS
jgi:hypothetical protein